MESRVFTSTQNPRRWCPKGSSHWGPETVRSEGTLEGQVTDEEAGPDMTVSSQAPQPTALARAVPAYSSRSSPSFCQLFLTLLMGKMILKCQQEYLLG